MSQQHAAELHIHAIHTNHPCGFSGGRDSKAPPLLTLCFIVHYQIH